MKLHRAAGVPRADVTVEQVQPLPWNAREVLVTFDGGPAFTCGVTRHPGDVLRLDRDGLVVPVATPAEIQWTQSGRGSYAAGVVVPGPDGAPGAHIRIDESVSGVERRLGTRLPVHLPATLTSATGEILRCHTENLSMGGAQVVADTDAAGLTTQAVLEVMLPTGAARLRCLTARTERDPAHIRVRFVDVDAATLGRIGTFLHAEQRRLSRAAALLGAEH